MRPITFNSLNPWMLLLVIKAESIFNIQSMQIIQKTMLIIMFVSYLMFLQ